MQNVIHHRIFAIVLFLSGLGATGIVHAQSAAAPESVKAAPTVVQAFHLRYVRANDASDILFAMIGREPELKIAVDERINAIIVSGSMERMKMIERLLQIVDRDSPNDKQRADIAGNSYRVHVDWLVTDESGKEVPDTLKAVEETLAKHGITNLRLAAATVSAVHPSINPEFLLKCSPVEGNVTLSIDGRFVASKSHVPALEIEINAKQQADSDEIRELAHVTTAVATPVGHPVVLAVAPISGVSSVFVVTVENSQSSSQQSVERN